MKSNGFLATGRHGLTDGGTSEEQKRGNQINDNRDKSVFNQPSAGKQKLGHRHTRTHTDEFLTQPTAERAYFGQG